MLRAIRHWFVARSTDAALAVAPHLSASAVDRVGATLSRVGPWLPVVAQNVAANMRALGLYTPDTHRAHFAELGRHFAGALHALRCGSASAELRQLAAQRITLDRSVEQLRAAACGGRGVILVGPHIANYLLNLARLNQAVPLTVYLRYSKDPRRRAAKARWYAASGVDWISEAADAGGALGRLGRMAAALLAGRSLFVTPDLPQKRGEGVPVSFFGREIYLPPGPAWLAIRTGAALYMLTARSTPGGQQLVVNGPQGDGPACGERGREARRAAVRERMQWFAGEFERFLRAEPALWYLWGDKRWTRLLRGDSRYVGFREHAFVAQSLNAPTDHAGGP